jgi:hypothetical protein
MLGISYTFPDPNMQVVHLVSLGVGGRNEQLSRIHRRSDRESSPGCLSAVGRELLALYPPDWVIPNGFAENVS